MSREKCHRCPETNCTQITKNIIHKDVKSNILPRLMPGRIMGCMEPLEKIDSCGYCGPSGVHCVNHSPRENGRDKIIYDSSALRKVVKREFISGKNIQACEIRQENVVGEPYYKWIDVFKSVKKQVTSAFL